MSADDASATALPCHATPAAERCLHAQRCLCDEEKRGKMPLCPRHFAASPRCRPAHADAFTSPPPPYTRFASVAPLHAKGRPRRRHGPCPETQPAAFFFALAHQTMLLMRGKDAPRSQRYARRRPISPPARAHAYALRMVNKPLFALRLAQVCYRRPRARVFSPTHEYATI